MKLKFIALINELQVQIANAQSAVEVILSGEVRKWWFSAATDVLLASTSQLVLALDHS